MRRPRPHIFVILGMLTAFLSVACATGRAPDPGASRASADSVQAKIKPLVVSWEHFPGARTAGHREPKKGHQAMMNGRLYL